MISQTNENAHPKNNWDTLCREKMMRGQDCFWKQTTIKNFFSFPCNISLPFAPI